MAAAPNPLLRRSNTRGREARAAVLDAATTLFAERGYAGTSIADVAKAASVAKPSVLYHFADKDTLWREAVEALWGEVEAFYAPRWPAETELSRKAVERMLDTYIEAALRWPAYVKIPFIEGATPSWRSEWLVDRHFGRHVRLANDLIHRCQEEGLLQAGEAAHIQALLTSGISMFATQSAMWSRALGTDAGAPEFLRRHAAMILNLTFRSETLASESEQA